MEATGEDPHISRPSPARFAGRFATTRWSLVIQAAAPDGRAALAELCRAYWSPVNTFIQRHGVSPEDAADVTQELFEILLSRNDMARLDPARGRFRSWLRTCARNHLYNWFARKQAVTAGGGVQHVELEAHASELKHELTAERLFDRRWALTVIERALARLKQRYERADKGALFAHLHVGLAGGVSELGDRELSHLLGKSVGALKVERHRLKQRFQDCLRAEVAETVAAPDEIDEELRQLLAALA